MVKVLRNYDAKNKQNTQYKEKGPIKLNKDQDYLIEQYALCSKNQQYRNNYSFLNNYYGHKIRRIYFV